MREVDTVLVGNLLLPLHHLMVVPPQVDLLHHQVVLPLLLVGLLHQVAPSSGGGGSSSGGSSAAPKKRKDGLLKRGLKKLVRGISKGVSTAAGAVKAGADYVTDRARKEELEATGLFSEKEIEAIMEAEMITRE